MEGEGDSGTHMLLRTIGTWLHYWNWFHNRIVCWRILLYSVWDPQFLIVLQKKQRVRHGFRSWWMITVLKLIPQSKCVLEDLRVIPCETLNFLLFSKKNSVPTSNSQRSTAPNTTITTTPGRSADLTSFLAQTFGFLLLTKNQRLLPWGAPCSKTLT